MSEQGILMLALGIGVAVVVLAAIFLFPKLRLKLGAGEWNAELDGDRQSLSRSDAARGLSAEGGGANVATHIGGDVTDSTVATAGGSITLGQAETKGT